MTATTGGVGSDPRDVRALDRFTAASSRTRPTRGSAATSLRDGGSGWGLRARQIPGSCHDGPGPSLRDSGPRGRPSAVVADHWRGRQCHTTVGRFDEAYSLVKHQQREESDKPRSDGATQGRQRQSDEATKRRRGRREAWTTAATKLRSTLLDASRLGLSGARGAILLFGRAEAWPERGAGGSGRSGVDRVSVVCPVGSSFTSRFPRGGRSLSGECWASKTQPSLRQSWASRTQPSLPLPENHQSGHTAFPAKRGEGRSIRQATKAGAGSLASDGRHRRRHTRPRGTRGPAARTIEVCIGESKKST